MAYADVSELSRVLRLRAPSTEQMNAMQRVLDAAATEIDSELGTAWGTPYPALVVEVNLERAVEHWSQQESPFGVIGMGETEPVIASQNTWERHAQKLASLKTSWGVA